MTDRPRGSFDDDPDQVPIPGLREAALTPEQKKAFAALEKLDKLTREKKTFMDDWKIRKDNAVAEAFDLLDKMGLQVGKIGRATFKSKVVRKLKVEIEAPKAKKDEKKTG